MKTDKIIKNILGDKTSKNMFFKEKETIPHNCYLCGKGPLEMGDYMYHKGNYYHTGCFQQPKKIKMEILRKRGLR